MTATHPRRVWRGANNERTETMSSTEPIYTPPPIAGYRKLSQAEVDLMNEIKAKGDEIGALVEKLRKHHDTQRATPPGNPLGLIEPGLDQRCVSIGATEIQTGIMWLVRAVARPTNF